MVEPGHHTSHAQFGTSRLRSSWCRAKLRDITNLFFSSSDLHFFSSCQHIASATLPGTTCEDSALLQSPVLVLHMETR